jgi:serine/threonine protein phosphatase PrpC
VPGMFSNLFNKKKSASKAGKSGRNEREAVNSGKTAEFPKQSTVHLDTPQILVGVAQSMGIQRETNEDSLFSLTSVLNINGDIKNFGLYIIADGMGGHENGEVASRIAIEKMSSHVINKLYLPSVSTAAGSLDDSIQEVMRAGVVKAHQAIKQNAKGGGTTLTAALVIGDQLTIAHVGDSRAYLLEPDWNLKLLTHDHSLVKRLEEIGQLTAEEASKNVKRNLLYRAVGQGDEIDPDVTSFRIYAGQMLFICTDGLWGVVPEKDIIQAVHASPEPHVVCQNLVNNANSAGGPDNISVILVHFPG